MIPRRLILFVSILIGTFPLVDAAALGLGDAELRSRLNQPLTADIELVGAAFRGDRIEARIGTASAPSAVVPASGALPNRLRAVVSVDVTGMAFVRVTTTEPVREPIVNFLLIVETARERVVREYTLLLDPPGYSLAELPTPAPARATERERTVPREPAHSAAVEPEHIGPIARGDTLSKLAIRRAAGGSATWAQMTWALYETNPHAFIDGDINKLRAGVYLEVPSREMMLSYTHREAVARIKGEYPRTPTAPPPAPPRRGTTTVVAREPVPVPAAPTRGQPDRPPPVPTLAEPDTPPPVATPEASTGEALEPAEPLFRVLSPDEYFNERSTGTVGSPASRRERERLRQLVGEANRRMRESREEIARTRDQLADTQLKISSLVETVEKKDSQIRSLESRLTELREFIKQQSEASSNSNDGWVQRLLLEAMILVTLVGVLAVTLSRWHESRRRTAETGEPDGITFELRQPTIDTTASPAVAIADPEPTEPVEPPEGDVGKETASLDDAEYEEIELRGEQLMEANAYLAYGYHEKAKEVLEDHIKQDPADPEARLVMLRTLHALKEKRRFRRHAEALLELIDNENDERWIEATRLGRAILPDERLFQADARLRAEDEKWEQTVWTGTRPDPADAEDHIYLDIDEFKYVDLFLHDGVESALETDPASDTDPSLDAAAPPEDTEAELANWRARMLGRKEDRGVRLDPETSAEEIPLDNLPDDEPGSD